MLDGGARLGALRRWLGARVDAEHHAVLARSFGLSLGLLELLFGLRGAVVGLSHGELVGNGADAAPRVRALLGIGVDIVLGGGGKLPGETAGAAS